MKICPDCEIRYDEKFFPSCPCCEEAKRTGKRCRCNVWGLVPKDHGVTPEQAKEIYSHLNGMDRRGEGSVDFKRSYANSLSSGMKELAHCWITYQ